MNTGTTIITTSQINAFAVGRQGSTRPAFHVNTAAGLSDTGIDIVSHAANGGVDMLLTGAGNVSLRLTAAGTGGGITLTPGSAASVTLAGNTTVTGTFLASGAATLSSTLVVAGAVTINGPSLSHSIVSGTVGVDWNITHLKTGGTGVGADDDVIFNWDFFAKDSGGGNSQYAKMEAVIETALAANEDGLFRWRVARNGGVVSKLVLSGALDALHPAGNIGASGLSLGLQVSGGRRCTSMPVPKSTSSVATSCSRIRATS